MRRIYLGPGSLRSAAVEWGSIPLLRNAYSLMLNVVLTSLLGIVFWVIAARTFPTEAVGRDSALVSSMIVVVVVCQLNLGPGIVRFLPIAKMSPRRVVLGAYAAAAGLAATGGVAFVLAAPRLANSYRFLSDHNELSVLYVVAVTMWSVFALEDSVLISLRRAHWVPPENAAYGIAKIALLPALVAMGATDGVFVAWVVPIVMVIVPINVLLFRRLLPAHSVPRGTPSPVERFGWGGIARYMAQDYVAAVLFVGTTTFLPVLVVAVRGGVDGAYFYMPFMIICAFDSLFVNVTWSFTVEGSMADRDIPSLARMTIVHFGWVIALGVPVLIVGAWLLLIPFGAAYASAGASVLRILACASVSRALIALSNAICRLEGKAHRVLATQAAVFGMTVGLVLLFGRNGSLQRVALAWLVANSATAIVLTPRVVRVYRAGRNADDALSKTVHDEASGPVGGKS